MKWKIFLMVCVSAAIVTFPQNIIGCGPDADPYDYYTSFFSQRLASVSTFEPFYYTGFNFLYDDKEPVDPADLLAQEWVSYCGQTVKPSDVKAFINDYSVRDVSNLYYNIEKDQPLKIPDSVRRNSMSQFFVLKKDLQALGYVLYAKKVQPYVLGSGDSWEPVVRDSSKMAILIRNGQQLLNAANNDFFKLKYAYQMIRLSHYSGQFSEAINLYDRYIPGINSKSILKPLSLALKAGAIYHNGDHEQAAYLFSKVFAETAAKRISNYISFNWSIDKDKTREQYLSYCKTDEERSAMLSMFVLGSTGNELPSFNKIYQWQPSSTLLEVIAGREINKLEEKYFTPLLKQQNGGKEFYFSWTDSQADSSIMAGRAEVLNLAAFLHKLSLDKQVSNQGLFSTAAAYCSYMARDYKAANAYLAEAKKSNLSSRVADQWALTNLLVTINESPRIDDAFEMKILPSLKWLREKANTEKGIEKDYYRITEWKNFYRNLMSTILAKRYHEQGEKYKEVLAIGNADNLYSQNEAYSFAVDYLHSNLVSRDVEQLYNLMTAKTKTAYQQWIISNNSLKVPEVVDFAGTAYLRDYDYSHALNWFDKAGASVKKFSIHKNPFKELLYDQEENLDDDKHIYTKPGFAKEMLRLEKEASADKTRAAADYYKMAIGMYNITYYGYTWELVQYWRSGSDGYYIPDDASAFQKEYYGCFTAHNYFKKAMESASNSNLKAKCLFMMAKCAQKNVRQPQYSDFGYDHYERYDSASRNYFIAFKNNKYFPQLVKDYGNTAFYKEALSSCSYLRDFIKK